MATLTLTGELNLNALVVAHANLLENVPYAKRQLREYMGARYGLLKVKDTNDYRPVYKLENEQQVEFAREAGLPRIIDRESYWGGYNLNDMQTFLRPELRPQIGDMVFFHYVDRNQENIGNVDILASDFFDHIFPDVWTWEDAPKQATQR